MAVVEVQVPDIGDFESVEVIEVLVKAGDTIRAEQSLVTVESDKSSMEIPSSQGGVVRELKVALGDKISQGTVLLTLEAPGGEGAAAEPASAKPETPPPAPAPEPASAPAPAGAAPAAPAGDDAPTVEARVPDIGDFAGVAVIELLVGPGDTVAVDQSLITVESDKSSMEIPSTVAGRIVELKVAIGDTVSKDSLIAIVAPEGAAAGSGPAPGADSPRPAADAPPPESSGSANAKAAAEATSEAASAAAGDGETSAAPRPTAAPAAAPPASAAPSSTERTPPTAALPALAPAAAPARLPHASPSIRKLARELGVPLELVAGSGPHGRITHDDVRNHVRAVMAAARQPAAAPAAVSAPGAFPDLLPWPQVDFAKFGPVERVDRPRIKKISAANLHRNWVSIPHVTNHADADVTQLEALRVQLNKEQEKAGVKVTLLAFILKACAAALQKFPEFNASLDGDQLVLKRYLHLGFAADTPNGLMVPVVRDVDKKGVLQISVELGELAKKAREGKLGAAEMTGGTFSVSSLGGVGGRYFTPIINAPEVAILGVGKSATEPVWDGSAFQPRLVLPLSLSYDHRVIDGAAAARFNTHLTQLLGDFRRVAL